MFPICDVHGLAVQYLTRQRVGTGPPAESPLVPEPRDSYCGLRQLHSIPDKSLN